MLLEEAQAAGVQPTPKQAGATPACDKLKAVGLWHTAWDPFFELSPDWTAQFMATVGGSYVDGVLSSKDAELLSIALDASITHMYAPGTRRHTKAALKVGATMEEMFEVLKICVVLGVQACNLRVTIRAEAMAHRSASTNQCRGQSHDTGDHEASRHSSISGDSCPVGLRQTVTAVGRSAPGNASMRRTGCWHRRRRCDRQLNEA